MRAQAIVVRLVTVAVVGAALAAAVIWCRRSRRQNKESGNWTCSMHPQIRLPKPGRCPICG